MSTSFTSSNFEALYDAALEKYTEQTGKDLRNHPLAHRIERCDSPASLLAPIANRLHALSTSAALSHAVSGTFPPATAIFTGINVLLSTAKSMTASYDALIDVFECLEKFIRRLVIYTEIPSTPAMTEMLVKIMAELLGVLALATKQIHQGRFKKYAKRLLGEKDIETVLKRLDRLTLEESRTTITQILGVMYSLVSNIQIVMEDGKASTDDIRQTLVLLQELVIKVNKSERDRLQKEFRRWLCAPDPWINHNLARKAHHRGTSTWFIQSDIYKQWKSDGSVMWIHGFPGSGKSVLCSTIIEDIQDMCRMGLAALAIFYFDFRDAAKMDTRSLLSSLLIQLCVQSNSFSQVLSSLYSTHVDGTRQPSEDALIECLKSMLELPGQGPLFVVVDALDECPNFSEYPTPREQVLMSLQGFIDLHLPHVHFCITSRPEVDVQDVLEPLAIHKVSLHEERGQNQDIVDYINSVVPSDPKLRRWREEDRKLVIKTLMEKAGGMFRWVHCQFETLRRCFPPSIRQTLDELPTTLDGTYEQTLRLVDKEKQAYAYRLFQCLVVSARPLHVEELAELFAIQPNEEPIPTFNADWRPEKAEESILSACSTLVTVVNVNGDQIFDDNINKDKLKNYHLASYAAQHWINHVQFENISSEIHDGLDSLFNRARPHFSTWIWIYDVDKSSASSAAYPESPGVVPLYYAALCGFRDIAERLIDAHPEDVNARGGVQVTPLHAALDRGHPDIARLLLEHGAHVRCHGSQRQTPLHLASRQGYANIMQSLMDRGADPDANMSFVGTPLYLASKYGRLESAGLLLDHGAEVNRGRNFILWTPLHAASTYGHYDVAKLLLDRGANIDAQTRASREVPLHLAVQIGHLPIVDLLLEYGANPHVQDSRGETPLQCALSGNRMQVVGLLSERTREVE
ncbi:hypothetical protein BC827DRAFT_1269518 [Russula dissimulans]|nr:hypothetical protein BC827DRAFT_1269518 [Russula dissimulans]